MVWFGWVLAAAAIAVAVWLWRLLRAERVHAGELLYEKIEVENELDLLRTQEVVDTGANASLQEVSVHLLPPLQSAQHRLEELDGQLTGYRDKVRQFDAAVQYCLQPVEMIFGADKTTLDQLVHHVEGARRKLFESRTAVEKHPLHSAADALGGTLDELHALTASARELRAPGTAGADAAADGGMEAGPGPKARIAH